jgi:hypothetical protein
MSFTDEESRNPRLPPLSFSSSSSYYYWFEVTKTLVNKIVATTTTTTKKFSSLTFHSLPFRSISVPFSLLCLTEVTWVNRQNRHTKNDQRVIKKTKKEEADKFRIVAESQTSRRTYCWHTIEQKAYEIHRRILRQFFRHSRIFPLPSLLSRLLFRFSSSIRPQDSRLFLSGRAWRRLLGMAPACLPNK